MDRLDQELRTQGVRHVQFNLTLKGQGAAAPLLLEGGAGFITTPLTRNSQGNYSFVTLDKFLAVVGTHATVQAATVTTSWGVTFGLPSQSATTFAWTFNFVTYVTNTGTATDLILNDICAVQLTFRNSLVLP